MSNAKTTNLKIQALKEELPTKWRKALMQQTGRSSAYLSRMVNKYQTDKPEWQQLLDLVKNHQALIQKNEADTSQLLSA